MAVLVAAVVLVGVPAVGVLVVKNRGNDKAASQSASDNLAAKHDATPQEPAEPSDEPTESTDEILDEPDTQEPTADPPAPPTGPAPPTSAQTQMEAEVYAATNAERQKAGLPALSVSSCGVNQAKSRVARLVAENKFEHYDMEPVMKACNAGVGENLSLGYPSGTAVVVDGWMNSPGHRANVLRPEFVSQGVSCQQQAGRWLCAAVYVMKPQG
ncbi:MAG: CAP domain-containing protein [Micrococcales bacterium]|nr:CAP domain-containing protein [Micrococcales bacterium]